MKLPGYNYSRPMISIINYMEPIAVGHSRLWRSQQFAVSLSDDYIVDFVTSSFSHFSNSYYSSTSVSNFASLQRFFPVFLYATPYSKGNFIFRVLSSIVFSFSLLFYLFRKQPSVVIASYPHGFSVLACSLYRLTHPNTSLHVDIRDNMIKLYSPLLFFYSLLDFLLYIFWLWPVDSFLGSGNSTLSYLPFYRLFSQFKSFAYHDVPFVYVPVSRSPSSSSQYFRRHCLSPSEPLRLIFCGTLTNSFDLEPFILLTSRINLKLTICGSGPLFEHLSLFSSHFPNVSFTGRVSNTQIENLLSEHHVGIMPYVDNGNFSSHFTNKFSEYLFYGLPLLVPSWATEMSNACIDHELGLVYDSYDCLCELLEDFSPSTFDSTISTYNHRYNNLFAQRTRLMRIFGS